MGQIDVYGASTMSAMEEFGDDMLQCGEAEMDATDIAHETDPDHHNYHWSLLQDHGGKMLGGAAMLGAAVLLQAQAGLPSAAGGPGGVSAPDERLRLGGAPNVVQRARISKVPNWLPLMWRWRQHSMYCVTQ